MSIVITSLRSRRRIRSIRTAWFSPTTQDTVASNWDDPRDASTSKINRPFSTRRVKCGKYVRKHRDFQRRLSSAELFLPCFCCPNSLQCIGFPNFELLTYLLCYLLDQKYLSQKKIAPVDETSISPQSQKYARRQFRDNRRSQSCSDWLGDWPITYARGIGLSSRALCQHRTLKQGFNN